MLPSPNPPPPQTICTLPPSYHCRLSALVTLHVAVGAAAAAVDVALVVAVVNFIYHLTFFTVFMLGGIQRHTLSDF